jgi:hypothetical protein
MTKARKPGGQFRDIIVDRPPSPRMQQRIDQAEPGHPHGVACPVCGADSMVQNKLAPRDPATIRRVRVCHNGHNFTTTEHVVYEPNRTTARKGNQPND